MRELIGARVQLVICKLLASAQQVNRVRSLLDLCLKQLMNTLPSRKLNPRIVGRDEQLLLFTFSQQRQLGEPLIWIHPNALQYNFVVPEQTVARTRCKKIA